MKLKKQPRSERLPFKVFLYVFRTKQAVCSKFRTPYMRSIKKCENLIIL